MASHLVKSGTLFVVATPLGHLGDLSPRAAETLRAVDTVAAEDTRRTRRLLAHLDAHPKLISYHAHSEAGKAETLLEILRQGRDLALVSDAGTPGVSDPGAELVAQARAAGFTVIPIPGPSAVATALSAAGLPADRYLFLGFIPRKGAERRRLLERAAAEEWTVVLYEAPTRLAALLRDLAQAAGAERAVMVARELTKIHEECVTGTLSELADRYAAEAPRGEITVVLAGRGAAAAAPTAPDLAAVADQARALLSEGLTPRAVVTRLTESSGLPRNEVYRLVLELK